MCIKLKLAAFLLLASIVAKAQVASHYEVALWSQFKSAAVSYTFDDNCSNQLPVALPLFDKLNFKVTFFTVTNWGPNWTGLANASANGHEIASHTVTHTALNTLTITNQDTELNQSQLTINSHITNSKCVTIAYPNCIEGDLSTIQKYYIAGRSCNNSIVSSSPSDFYSLGSIITGDLGAVKTAQDFNDKVSSAKISKGWCVFLTHGIDNDGGYSPTSSSEISSHLTFMDVNNADYWVAPFGNVVKYIRERNTSTVRETVITNDSLQIDVHNTLDNTTYNEPLTIRRLLPTGWQNAAVYLNNTLINSTISHITGSDYVTFDVVPDQGKIFMSSRSSVVTGIENSIENSPIRIHPNPFSQEITLDVDGDFTFTIVTLEGKVLEDGSGSGIKTIGKNLRPGMYILWIRRGSNFFSTKLIKK
ncbi:MAG TPA: polysaccharide deacetylase family protein [Cyclobacteriaceae bacterium]|jgi:oligosaccharide reducing-end xylanase|nr:polysaccharide deacetylase family protein [Cyclobacteriaceae bacterium]